MMKLLDVPEIAFDRTYPFEHRYFDWVWLSWSDRDQAAAGMTPPT